MPDLTHLGTEAAVSGPFADDGLDTDLVPLFLLRYEAPNTRRAYANDLRQFYGSDVVTLRMARATTFVHVNEHLAALRDGGARPRTLQRRTAALRTFFSWLQALELLDGNPADRHLVRRVKRNQQAHEALTVLTRDQALRLFDALDPDRSTYPRDRALIDVLLHCVLRRSEAAMMDFEHVRQSGSYWVLDLPHTKGGADQYVKLPDHVRIQIDTLKSLYGSGTGPVWRSWSNNSYGRRLSARSIYDIVRRAARRAGIEATVGAHTLRHTGCTLAIEAGASVQQVQTHARHRNIETTMVYVHHRDRLRDNAADYIDLTKR